MSPKLKKKIRCLFVCLFVFLALALAFLLELGYVVKILWRWAIGSKEALQKTIGNKETICLISISEFRLI